MTDKPAATGSGEAKTCPECGYTEADARFNMDHHLCRNAGRAPWEPLSQIEPTPTPPASPTVTLDRETYDKALNQLSAIVDSTPCTMRNDCKCAGCVTFAALALLRAAERHQP